MLYQRGRFLQRGPWYTPMVDRGRCGRFPMSVEPRQFGSAEQINKKISLLCTQDKNENTRSGSFWMNIRDWASSANTESDDSYDKSEAHVKFELLKRHFSILLRDIFPFFRIDCRLKKKKKTVEEKEVHAKLYTLEFSLSPRSQVFLVTKSEELLYYSRSLSLKPSHCSHSLGAWSFR